MSANSITAYWHKWLAKPPNYTVGAAEAQEWVTSLKNLKKREIIDKPRIAKNESYKRASDLIR